MADASIGDDELRAELERYGFSGPINDKTRSCRIKQLNHFRAREASTIKENNRQKKSTRHSTAIPQHRQEDDDDRTNGFSNERVLRRRTIVNPPRHIEENGDSHEGRSRTDRSPTRSPGRLPRLSNMRSSTPIRDLPAAPVRDLPKPRMPEKPSNSYIGGSLGFKSSTPIQSNAGQTPTRNMGFLSSFLGGHSNDKPKINSQYPTKRSQVERSVTEFSDSEGECADLRTQVVNPTFSYEGSFGQTPKSHPPSYSSLGYPSNRTRYDAGRYAKESSKSGSSNFVSRIVFFGLMLFFALVVLMYFYNAFVVTPLPTSFISRGTVCVTVEDKEVCLNDAERSALDDLVMFLARRNGEITCGVLRPESPDGFVTVNELTNHLQQKYEDVGLSKMFAVNIENLLLLVQNRQDWNISLRCRLPDNPSTLTQDCQKSATKHITSLRSERQIMSLTCRINRAFKLVTFKIFLTIISVVILIGSIWVAALLKRRKDKRVREVNSLANEIVGLLQNHASQCRDDPMVKPYLPVSHIRDALISLPERTKKANVWNEAVKQLAENETRIVQEIRDVAGEDTAVWRWNELTGIDLFGAKRMQEETPKTRDSPKQQQQQQQPAKFTSTPEMKRLNMLPFDSKLMSSCIKVCNILPHHTADNYIPEQLRDALLDKCGQYHGILHIGCDYKIEEGVIYVKCISESAANQNYKALHGWVYEGRLASVKHVSPLVYKMIFVDSEDAMVTLKSSTHRRRP